MAATDRPAETESWPEMSSSSEALHQAVAKNEARIKDLVGSNAELERLMDACETLDSSSDGPVFVADPQSLPGG